MQVRELTVTGALEFTPTKLSDHRGALTELLRWDQLREALGRDFPVAQVNCTVNHRNVVRGVHFTRLVGQAKLVSCLAGSMVDVIFDTRAGSPSFGRVDMVWLDSERYRIVYVPEGVGHGIASLTDQTTALYFCSAPYDPNNEYGINPMDPQIGIDWRALSGGAEPILSHRDQMAPSLDEVTSRGLLPEYQQCLEVYGSFGQKLLHRRLPGPWQQPAPFPPKRGDCDT